MALHNDIGRIGEDIAEENLRELGFEILYRNFRRPYGEIDIVARESSGFLVFVEVKTVSWETGAANPLVSYETGYRPEDNVHPQKLKRLSRIIEAYLMSTRYLGEWRFDVMAVFVDPKTKIAKIRHTKDIVIGS
jgi:putative endonuclease